MTARRLIVIGGGAAGLMAAGRAAEFGADVTVLEKMNRPARKLRITGKGRCNITNASPIDEFIKRFGDGWKFIRPAIYAFPPDE